jgi:hypothetical protein
MLLCSVMYSTVWVRVLFARSITAVFFSLCTYLQSYIKLDTVICKYLNLDVFVVVFYSFVIVKFYILVTVHLVIIPINNQYRPVCRSGRNLPTCILSPTRSDIYQMLY